MLLGVDGKSWVGVIAGGEVSSGDVSQWDRVKMKLNQLPRDEAKVQEPKRKGRGMASGNGKTGGRGTKGQHARSGGFHRVGFEGGQMPLQRRLPKRGFHNPFKKEFALVHLKDLEVFEAGAVVTEETLRQRRLVGDVTLPIKLLGDGEVTKAWQVTVSRASRGAVAKVEAAGGRVTQTMVSKDGA